MSQILSDSSPGGSITSITSTGGTIAVTNPTGPITNVEVVGGGFLWESVALSKTAEVNKGYIISNVALVVLTLPAVAPVGSVIKVLGAGLAGWEIAQPAGVAIEYDTIDVTTTGTTGKITSNNHYDSIELVCTTANLLWGVQTSKGNFNML